MKIQNEKEAEKHREEKKEKQRQYYEKNRHHICDNVLNRYGPKAMDQINKLCPDTVNEYCNRYPFEEYGEPLIIKLLNHYKIFSYQARYHDCFEAGMLAYLFSMHRCAYLGIKNVKAYINKMIRIYVICALTIYDDTKNLCKANDFKEVRIDADYSVDHY